MIFLASERVLEIYRDLISFDVWFRIPTKSLALLHATGVDALRDVESKLIVVPVPDDLHPDWLLPVLVKLNLNLRLSGLSFIEKFP